MVYIGAIDGSPFALAVKPAAVHGASSEVVDGASLSLTAGDEGIVEVQARDEFGNIVADSGTKLEYTLHGAAEAHGEVSGGEGGVHKLVYSSRSSGAYELWLGLDGNEIKGSPFGVLVLPGKIDAQASKGAGLGLSAAVAGVDNEFIVEARDSFGNRRDRGGGDVVEVQIHQADSGAVALTPAVHDSNDGFYRCS